jgi:hypothetical protein
MVRRLLVACCLMAVCVTIHAGGLTCAIRRLRRLPTPEPGFWTSTRLFVLVAVWIVLLHLVEITVWAVAYFANGAILQRRHVHDDRIWGPRTAKGMASGRRRRSADRYPDVRMVDGILFRDRQSLV